MNHLFFKRQEDNSFSFVEKRRVFKIGVPNGFKSAVETVKTNANAISSDIKKMRDALLEFLKNTAVSGKEELMQQEIAQKIIDMQRRTLLKVGGAAGASAIVLGGGTVINAAINFLEEDNEELNEALLSKDWVDFAITSVFFGEFLTGAVTEKAGPLPALLQKIDLKKDSSKFPTINTFQQKRDDEIRRIETEQKAQREKALAEYKEQIESERTEEEQQAFSSNISRREFISLGFSEDVQQKAQTVLDVRKREEEKLKWEERRLKRKDKTLLDNEITRWENQQDPDDLEVVKKYEHRLTETPSISKPTLLLISTLVYIKGKTTGKEGEVEVAHTGLETSMGMGLLGSCAAVAKESIIKDPTLPKITKAYDVLKEERESNDQLLSPDEIFSTLYQSVSNSYLLTALAPAATAFGAATLMEGRFTTMYEKFLPDLFKLFEGKNKAETFEIIEKIENKYLRETLTESFTDIFLSGDKRLTKQDTKPAKDYLMKDFSFELIGTMDRAQIGLGDIGPLIALMQTAGVKAALSTGMFEWIINAVSVQSNLSSVMMAKKFGFPAPSAKDHATAVMYSVKSVAGIVKSAIKVSSDIPFLTDVLKSLTPESIQEKARNYKPPQWTEECTEMITTKGLKNIGVNAGEFISTIGKGIKSIFKKTKTLKGEEALQRKKEVDWLLEDYENLISANSDIKENLKKEMLGLITKLRKCFFDPEFNRDEQESITKVTQELENKLREAGILNLEIHEYFNKYFEPVYERIQHSPYDKSNINEAQKSRNERDEIRRILSKCDTLDHLITDDVLIKDNIPESEKNKIQELIKCSQLPRDNQTKVLSFFQKSFRKKYIYERQNGGGMKEVKDLIKTKTNKEYEKEAEELLQYVIQDEISVSDMHHIEYLIRNFLNLENDEVIAISMYFEDNFTKNEVFGRKIISETSITSHRLFSVLTSSGALTGEDLQNFLETVDIDMIPKEKLDAMQKIINKGFATINTKLEEEFAQSPEQAFQNFFSSLEETNLKDLIDFNKMEHLMGQSVTDTLFNVMIQGLCLTSITNMVGKIYKTEAFKSLNHVTKTAITALVLVKLSSVADNWGAAIVNQNSTFTYLAKPKLVERFEIDEEKLEPIAENHLFFGTTQYKYADFYFKGVEQITNEKDKKEFYLDTLWEFVLGNHISGSLSAVGGEFQKIGNSPHFSAFIGELSKLISMGASMENLKNKWPEMTGKVIAALVTAIFAAKKEYSYLLFGVKGLIKNIPNVKHLNPLDLEKPDLDYDSLGSSTFENTLFDEFKENILNPENDNQHD